MSYNITIMSFDTYFDYLYHIVMASPNKRKPTFTNFGSPKKGKKPDESKTSSFELFICGPPCTYQPTKYGDKNVFELRVVWPITAAKDGSAAPGLLVLNNTQATTQGKTLVNGTCYKINGQFA